MMADVSSARGFSAAQLDAYWAANTALQHLFPSRPAEEIRRAAASMVRMGLKKSDFANLAPQAEALRLKAAKRINHLDALGLSLEQMVEWIRAPGSVAVTDQVATQDERLNEWVHAQKRASAIESIATKEQLGHGGGALVAVGCAAAAGIFWGVGQSVDNPDLTQTGGVRMEYGFDWIKSLKEVDWKTVGGKMAATGTLVLGIVGARAWVGEKDKTVVEAERVNLKGLLSHKQLSDSLLIERLGEIPKAHACLLSHLGREDLGLFIKGDDALRATILKQNPPDHTQRRQFAYLEAQGVWQKVMLQLDVSLLRWDNPLSATGSDQTLLGLRAARQARKAAEGLASPEGTRPDNVWVAKPRSFSPS